mgnify:CR=1 FL=1
MTQNAVTFVLNNPGLRDDMYEVIDMFDLQDEDQDFCDQCGCDLEYSGNAYMCESCREEEEEYA